MPKRPAVYTFEGYSAVIPQIQNIYAPEEDRAGCGWYFGFKYSSGVFEFFNFATLEDARREHDRLIEAVDVYWRR